MTTLSVVIPALNEEQGIEEISRRVLSIKENLKTVGVSCLELLVVDDGSTDNTAEIARSIDGVQLLSHPQNRGYGAALQTGFLHAEGELIGFLDADGTYPPEFFPELCREALDGAELVVGTRMTGMKSDMPITRRIGNFLFARLLSLIGNLKISDSASGMRVFKREILHRLMPLPDGLNLTPVMSARAIYERIILVEVPIPYSERVGRSKLSVVHDGSLFLRSIVWTGLSYNPVRILGLLGLGGVAITVLSGMALIVARLMGTTTLAPWSVGVLFIAQVSGVVGLSLFALGSTFNYLVSLFYKRPIRQGLFGKPIFNPPLDTHFGWMGLLTVLLGLGLGITSLALGINGWDISRLWLYLLGSALFVLFGAQLIIYWVLMRVLEELSQREIGLSDRIALE